MPISAASTPRISPNSRSCSTTRSRCTSSAGYEWKLNGKAEYLASITQAFHNQSIGHHNGHHPEIQILSETEATGIWYLADNMWQLNSNHFTTGTAIYWDRYQKVDGRWLIRETRYRRIYELNSQLPETPKPATHYLGSFGTPLAAK
ncbi:MAG: nuclear transport factor 2 family protein [Gammaproteobacteria bacterium]|nr:nuclear transport factor 2 family protein [Gammaproteobacteria bacterium]